MSRLSNFVLPYLLIRSIIYAVNFGKHIYGGMQSGNSFRMDLGKVDGYLFGDFLILVIRHTKSWRNRS